MYEYVPCPDDFDGETTVEMDDRLALHRCEQQGCHCDSVYPVSVEKIGDKHRWVQCRCPNCNWMGDSIRSDEQMADYDAELQTQDRQIARNYKSLRHIVEEELFAEEWQEFQREIDHIAADRQNLHHEVDEFVLALQDNRILPEDIGRII
jgi:hypothetical protein